MASTPGEGASRALAKLTVQKGPDVGHEHTVERPVVTVGKGSQNDVVIVDDSVSTTHARLEYERGAWRITDLASTNGTYVEGVKLAPEVPTPLAYGSTVRFGGIQLHFRPVESADPERARAEYVAPEPATRVRDRRSGFRLPLWLLLLILVLLAVAVYLFGWVFAEPAAEPTAVESVGTALRALPPPAS